MKRKMWTSMAFLASLVLNLTSCGGGPVPNFLTPAEIQDMVALHCDDKLRIFVAVDQTVSMKTAGTRPVTVEQFDPLVDKLLRCSGELAVGFIREHPGAGTERIFFSELPKFPEAPVKRDDEEPYEFSDRLDAYNAQLVSYKKQSDDRRAAMKPQIEDFRSRLKSALERKPAHATDFNSMLNVANTFLMEGVDGSNSDTRRFAIIVSDALDTAGRPRFKFASDAKVFWVNATTDAGKLAGLNVSRVESFDAAVREITGGTK